MTWISRPAGGKYRGTQAVGARFGIDRKKKVRCTLGEIGKIKVVKDFLPPPNKRVAREANVKVTVSEGKAAPSRQKTSVTVI